MSARMLAPAVGRVLKTHRWHCGARPWPLITHVCPQIAGFGAAPAWIQHRQGSVIGVHVSATEHVAPYRRHQRTDQMEPSADPVRERRSIDLHPGITVDLAL